MRWQDYIHQDPQILVGKPVFIGTRISVEMVLEEMAAGDSPEQITKSYPHITSDHVRAALAYAAAALRQDETVFLEANIAP
jgi:uncharacterized protein (DUF433 family)